TVRQAKRRGHSTLNRGWSNQRRQSRRKRNEKRQAKWRKLHSTEFGRQRARYVQIEREVEKGLPFVKCCKIAIITLKMPGTGGSESNGLVSPLVDFATGREPHVSDSSWSCLF